MKMNSNLKRFIIRLKGIIRAPQVTLVIGILMVVCGFFEAVETTIERFLDHDIGAHHGIILFGLIQVLYAFILMIEGVENMGTAVEESRLEGEIEELKLRK